MYMIRYCQRALLRISFCLLLVCSANVASAQTASLSGAETDGLTIRFTINLPSALDNLVANAHIQIDGISLSDISSVSSNNGGCGPDVIPLETGDDTSLQYLICTRNTLSQEVELTLNEPNRPTTGTVTLLDIASRYMSSVDTNNNTFNFTVNPLIRIRVKVFLEGPLAMTHPLRRRGIVHPYSYREIRYTIRYCALLRISFCLLLVCSANVAFAQMASLSGDETDGLTIRFTINLPSALDDQLANAIIQIDGIDSSDIRSASACNYQSCRHETPPRHFDCYSSQHF